MFTALREVQIPVLAVMLLGACAAKVWRALHARTAAAGAAGAAGVAGVVPLHLRRPAVVLLFTAEALLGLGLIGTAGRLGGAVPHLPATIVRTATALFFLVALGALNELRQRRPDAGCGCFGDLSDTPIGLRAIARSGVLCAAAVATIGLPPLRRPSSSAEAVACLAVLAVELVLIAFLSPELGDILVRLGYTEPCELQRIPVGRTMSVLRASSPWRRYASQVSTAEPADVWREGCWRFVVYPGIVSGRRVDIVFAVYLQARRPAIRVAVLDAATDEILGLAAARPSAVL